MGDGFEDAVEHVQNDIEELEEEYGEDNPASEALESALVEALLNPESLLETSRMHEISEHMEMTETDTNLEDIGSYGESVPSSYATEFTSEQRGYIQNVIDETEEILKELGIIDVGPFENLTKEEPEINFYRLNRDPDAEEYATIMAFANMPTYLVDTEYASDLNERVTEARFE